MGAPVTPSMTAIEGYDVTYVTLNEALAYLNTQAIKHPHEMAPVERGLTGRMARYAVEYGSQGLDLVRFNFGAAQATHVTSADLYLLALPVTSPSGSDVWFYLFRRLTT